MKLQQKQPNLTRPGAIRQLIDPVIGVDLKELTLLVITLSGYLAGRLCGEREIRRRLMMIESAVMAAGALATWLP
ncbi:hypothetical protein [Bradyrhizobium sp. WSM1743]|uniref:hypothetical protein n=1 Tax=Bradyrhizobium sp. WSM1743 TaxID=318996 RepID=UPI000487C18F|nr:hypothetical protein [Bradyrhizobium sp. WSM1743]